MSKYFIAFTILFTVTFIAEDSRADGLIRYAPASMAHNVPSEFKGTFQASQSKAGFEEIIKEAIHTSTQRMNFLTRRVARKKLASLTNPCLKFTFSFPSQDLSIQCEARPPNIAPLDGTPRQAVGATGEQYTLIYQVSPNQIVQTFQSENGSREDVYVLHRESAELHVQTTIRSKWLATPVRYTLTFSQVQQTDS